jgi:hypothetical protein
MLPIKDEEEACEEVGPLVVPKPLEEVIAIFLEENDIDKLETSVSESDRDRRSLGWRFSRISFFQFQRKDQIQGTHLLFVLMNAIEWS